VRGKHPAGRTSALAQQDPIPGGEPMRIIAQGMTSQDPRSGRMNKFRTLGFIDYNGHLQVHSSLLSVVLHD
jgi:hypothetical protein